MQITNKKGYIQRSKCQPSQKFSTGLTIKTKKSLFRMGVKHRALKGTQAF